mgnify:CR=1 FL=1|nr:MAG TPA: hypothetical protein [Caudoviricetes sp.]
MGAFNLWTFATMLKHMWFALTVILYQIIHSNELPRW